MSEEELILTISHIILSYFSISLIVYSSQIRPVCIEPIPYYKAEHIVQIIEHRFEVRTFQTVLELSNDYIDEVYFKEQAKHQLKDTLAQHLKDYMEVEEEYDVRSHRDRLIGKINLAVRI